MINKVLKIVLDAILMASIFLAICFSVVLIYYMLSEFFDIMRFIFG